jgi:hypothetical protein
MNDLGLARDPAQRRTEATLMALKLKDLLPDRAFVHCLDAAARVPSYAKFVSSAERLMPELPSHYGVANTAGAANPPSKSSNARTQGGES